MSVENKAHNFLTTGSLLGDFLDNIHTYACAVRTSFGMKDTDEQTTVSETQPIDILEQGLSLNVSTLASARRAAKLMMPRLSPMPVDKMVWDIVGPNGEGLEGKYNYTLGFVRLNDLTKSDEEIRGIKTQTGNTYSFTSNTHLIAKRKKTLFQLFGFTACYCALLFAGFEWSERPANITQNWQTETRQIRLETAQLQNTSKTLEAQSGLMDMYQGGSQSLDVLNVLSVTSQALPDAGWIQQLNSTEQQVRINGLTDDPTKLATFLEAKPSIARVELGIVSTDRATGLQRFVLTVFLVEA